MKHGANIISIMFDDIPPENLKNIEKKQEGIFMLIYLTKYIKIINFL